jgi:threonine dehydrogenase-like Zn-dependent dehydrogenase
VVMLNDHGSSLMPVSSDKGYAEIALTEPWACVVAAYRLEYRTGIKPGGTMWVIGAGDERPFTISAGFDASAHPARLLLSQVPSSTAAWLRQRAAEYGVEVSEVPDISAPPVELADDIIVLGSDTDVVERISPRLAVHGILVSMAQKPMPRPANIDVGRIHYHRWLYVGSTGLDISRAYRDVPVRSNLKPGGKVWFVGAGGPIGRMHVQRAIEFAGHPAAIVCTDVSDMRLEDLCTTYRAQAKASGIEFVCLNPMNKESYAAGMQPFFAEGFDDIVVLAPVPAVISDSSTHLSPKGVMNVFAGVARGTMASIDLSSVYLNNVRIIGHSGSVMTDMRLTLDKVLSSELLTNRSVAAVGSLSAAYAGLQALKDAAYPGKVVIYPNIKELPLTSLPELKEKMPSVYAKLANGREWTNEAEAEFLRIMLP